MLEALFKMSPFVMRYLADEPFSYTRFLDFMKESNCIPSMSFKTGLSPESLIIIANFLLKSQ